MGENQLMQIFPNLQKEEDSKMGVMTVNGVIRKEELGITSPHEHALIDISNQYPGDRTPGSLGWDGKVAKEHYDLLMADPYALRDNLILDDKEMAVAEVDIFAKAGGGTFVDVTLGHIGRDVEFLKRLSDKTGLHVVAATGFYTADAHPERVANMTVEELAEEMIKELTEGIDGTDIKAGIIGEIGTSMELHEDEIKVLKASALAHIKTGAPVMVHLCPWVKHGMQVVDILEEHGVSPESICLCHTDVLLDVEDMRNLLERGVYLEFDNFGKEFTQGSAYGRFPSDEERMEVFYQLIDAGYMNQLLVACDVCLKNLLTVHGGPGYGHMLLKIQDMIREKCPNAEEILRAVLVDNPARYLNNLRLG